MPYITYTLDVTRCSYTETSKGIYIYMYMVFLPPTSIMKLNITTYSANILVTEEWSAALGDYGVLRTQPTSGTMVTTTVAGTTEYMDPDYIRGGAISEKTDIYSFGVVSVTMGTTRAVMSLLQQVLFELLLGVTACGPVTVNHHDNIDGTDIVSFVEDFEGTVSSVLIGEWPDKVGQIMWRLAECCIDGNRRKRPDSNEVSPPSTHHSIMT